MEEEKNTNTDTGSIGIILSECVIRYYGPQKELDNVIENKYHKKRLLRPIPTRQALCPHQYKTTNSLHDMMMIDHLNLNPISFLSRTATVTCKG